MNIAYDRILFLVYRGIDNTIFKGLAEIWQPYSNVLWLFHLLTFYVLTSLCLILPLIVSIAFFTIAERKIMASIQRRKGPNVVGVWGLLQPFADGLKAILKELIIPYQVNRFLFIIAPSITFILSLVN